MSDAPCRVVNIEWDRGHERFYAILRAESPDGVIFTEIVDITTVPRLSWIRRNEVLEIDDLDEDAGAVRLAEVRGERAETVDRSLTAVGPLLVHLASTEPLVAIYRERTGSDELLVGKIVATTPDTVTLQHVDTNGRYDEEGRLDHPLREIIRVDWGTSYVTALWELLAAGD
jgi:hypothetical protein